MADIKPKSVNFSSQINSRDYYKGTSFRWAGMWEVGKLYSNDTFFVDFVSYNGKVYVCVKSHYASNTVTPENSEYWNLAIDSAAGTNGVDGKPGANAIHVGTESPCEYKNAHADDSDIQAKYAYCENMLWINPEDSSESSYVEFLYNAYLSCGGTLSEEEFCANFSNIVSSKVITEDYLKNYVTREELDNVYTKEEINDLIDGIEGVDLSDYYTKEETSNLYLTKEQVESIIIEGDELI